MTDVRALFLHALTPVHSGTGQAVSVIDLPVAREKATGYPVIPATSLKGVVRGSYAGSDSNVLFGTVDKAGTLTLTDQRLLCLAVRSYFGTFAYVTSPLALGRLIRDAAALGASFQIGRMPEVSSTTEIHLHSQSVLAHDGKVYLEDLDLQPVISDATEVGNALAQILFHEDARTFTSRFAIVSDEVFSFLAETATEVVARVRLMPDTKTVERGALWYEEAVPAETIFAGFALCEAGAAALEGVDGTTIQIGGDASVGRGLCRVVVTK